MSAMLKGALVNYSGNLAGVISLLLVGIFLGMIFRVMRASMRASFEYEANLPLDLEQDDKATQAERKI